MPSHQRDPKAVFLNVPYDPGYERQFVALVATIIAIGRIPRCVLEIAETGEGRLRRLLNLIRACEVSVHDLSRVGVPPRFNMPFELGLSCAIARSAPGYKYLLLERVQHRVQKTLSDLNGRDPYIHGGTVRGTVTCVLDAMRPRSGAPDVDEVYRFCRTMSIVAREIKRKRGRGTLFARTAFLDLVTLGTVRAQQLGFISS